MTNPKQIIVVEGEADRQVIECLCEVIGISPEIKMFTPKDLTKLQLAELDTGISKPADTKTGIYNILKSLLKQLENGDLENLAIVVDADQTGSNLGGFNETLKQIQQRLIPYQLTDSTNGLIFTHPHGGSPIGVWIMPNNQDDGMIESWLAHCIHHHENPLFQKAKNNTPQQTEQPKFGEHHRTKAEVATWLAWQKKPSIGLYSAFIRHQDAQKNKQLSLLNSQSTHYQNLVTWLNYVFPEPPKH
jgi:hypothetical protein